MPRPGSFLRDRRLYLLAGKGGSGKSILSSALALTLQHLGRRVLAASATDPEGLARHLSPQPADGETDSRQGVVVLRLDPIESLEDFGELRVGSRRLLRSLVRSRAARPFLEALPGLKGLAFLGRLWYSLTHPPDAPAFDAAVVETSGMGHLPRLLSQPGATAKILPPCVLRQDLEEIHSFLMDTSRTALILVTQPEHYSVEETLDLYRACRATGRLPDLLVVNASLPDWLPTCHERARQDLPSLPTQLSLLAARKRAQARAIANLKALSLPRIDLPLLPGGLPPPQRALQLAKRIFQELDRF